MVLVLVNFPPLFLELQSCITIVLTVDLQAPGLKIWTSMIALIAYLNTFFLLLFSPQAHASLMVEVVQ